MDYREVGVSVKDYTPYTELARQVPGLSEGIISDELAQSIYYATQEDFWREADAITQRDWGHECVAEGRTGGWAVPFLKGEGYVALDDEWRVTITDLADHYIKDVWPERLRQAIKEAKAEKLAEEAENIRLSLIGTDEKVAAYEIGMNLTRALLRLSDHFDLNIGKLIEEAREETA